MKMLKIIMSVLMLAMFALCIVGISPDRVQADDYTVLASTYDVAGSTTDFASGGYPNISGGAKIDQFYITNSSAVAQTVSIYDTATSTSAASLALTIHMPASIGPIEPIKFPYFNALKLQNMAVKKSATGSVVAVNVNYR